VTDEDTFDRPAALASQTVDMPPATSVPPVVGARQLIGSSFELLTRSAYVMRRASFYVGLILLGLAGPLALALWGSLLAGFDPERIAAQSSDAAAAGLWLVVLGGLFAAGIVVCVIESTAVTIALLGGLFSGRPVTIRQAVERSRVSLWSIVVANLAVSIPTAIVREVIGQTTEARIVAGLIVGTLIQTPFVYAASGIVLGNVGPLEALKRSVTIVRARKIAALILAILPSVYGLLVVIALEAGIDVAARAMDALGLGLDSGPLGVALITVLIVMVTFALGTLLYTVTAIVYAPQVVMFVGLTRATMGLDRVRPGGDRDPDRHGPQRPPFRWLTRPMLAGFVLGAVALAGFLTTIRS
jgi:hypothetical protein